MGGYIQSGGLIVSFRWRGKNKKPDAYYKVLWFTRRLGCFLRTGYWPRTVWNDDTLDLIADLGEAMERRAR